MSWQRAIIVGGSSGIGAELAKQLAASGCRVAILGRNSEQMEAVVAENPSRISAHRHDVSYFDEVPGLFQQITKELSGLDLFVYSSGVMPEVGADEFEFEKDQRMIDVNISGAVAWLNQAATRMQGTRNGTIVAIGSVAGDRGRLGQPVYNASKAFLATYMEALRNRLSRLGVKVVTIKPGPVETPLIAHLNIANAMPVEVAASKILQKSKRGGEHYLNWKHGLIFFFIRNTPSAIFRRLKV